MMEEFEPISYEQYREEHKEPKYFGKKCFIPGCDNPAEYEGGDCRFYCGMCEEHVELRQSYDAYVAYLERKKHIREIWSQE